MIIILYEICMKVKEGYMLRNVADNYIVVAVGENALDFNGLITTNETGAFLWELLEDNKSFDDLLSSVLNEYEIDEATAKADIDGFIKKLKDADLLEL